MGGGGEIAVIPYVPPTEIVLTAEQAKKVRINENVKIFIEGKATGITQQKTWDDKKKKDVVTGYVLRMDKPTTVDIKTNPAAKALKGLKKGTNG